MESPRQEPPSHSPPAPPPQPQKKRPVGIPTPTMAGGPSCLQWAREISIGARSVLCPQQMSLGSGVGAPWREGHPCPRASHWGSAPLGIYQPQGPIWHLGDPGAEAACVGRSARAGPVLPGCSPHSQRPASSSLPLGLPLTPCPLGPGPWAVLGRGQGAGNPSTGQASATSAAPPPQRAVGLGCSARETGRGCGPELPPCLSPLRCA